MTLERAKTLMTDARKEHKWKDHLTGQGSTGGDNVITGCIKDDGSEVKRTYPCHRPINSFSNAKTLWSAFGYRTNFDIGSLYFDWLVKRSPWSKIGIVPKLDEEFMFSSGFVWTDLDKVPANKLHNFLVASRSAGEWPKYVIDWYTLVTKHDVDETLAYFMVTIFSDANGSVGDYNSFLMGKEVALASGDKYDWPLDTFRCDEQYLKNFLAGVPVGTSSWMFYPTAQTIPVNTLWGSVNSNSTYISELAKRYSHLWTTRTIKLQFSPSYDVKVLTKEVAINIIKQEELRLGLKTERKAA